jgi:glycosyltransferase involved in cell wall biosynthesis
MKIAIVHPIPLTPGTIDLLAYARRFEEMGHQSLIVTSKYLRSPTDLEIVERSMEQMAESSTWRELGIDLAVTFLWFQRPEITEALNAAGCRVVSRADSDGQQSIRLFPGSFFRCMVGAAGPQRRFTEFKSFVHRYLIRYRSEDEALIRTVAASHVVAIETREAAQNLQQVLKYYGREDIAGRIVVIPHCIDDCFLHDPIERSRPKKVIAVGRWTASQKNPELLLRTITREVERNPDTSFTVIGPGATKLCGESAAKMGRVDCHEHVSMTEIPRFLKAARVLLSSSRWEGSPISANEALASGCSVVGTPIPAFLDIAAAGPFGSASTSHSVRSLHKALQQELRAWETGDRSPVHIAQFWRPRLSQWRVTHELLAAAYPNESAAVSLARENAILQPQMN